MARMKGKDRWPSDVSRVIQQAAARAWDVNAIIAGAGMRDVEYCSKDEITWIYKVRARWIPDNERARCQGCDTAFSFTERRHHCRRCGEIYCGACSTAQTVVGVPATEPGKAAVDVSNGAVRVCTGCLNQMTADGFGG